MGLYESLYVPMEKYHLAQTPAITGTGFIDQGKEVARQGVAIAAAGKDTTTLVAQIALNGNVDVFLDKLTSKADPNAKMTPQQEALTMSIIDKWKKDDKFLSNLNNDLADPATAARLQQVAEKNPAGVAAALSKYKGGNLAAILPTVAAAAPAAGVTQTAPSPAPTPAQTAAPPATGAPARPAPAAASAAAPPPVAAPAGGQAAPAQTPPPAQTPAPAQTAPAPAAAAGAPATGTPKPPTERDLLAGVMKELASKPDEELKKAITPLFVKRLASGLAEYGGENFPDLQTQSKGFKDKVANSPELQKQIADNLQKNPQLVRDIAGLMENKDAMKSGVVKSGVRDTLKQVYEDPMLLAQKDYTDRLAGKMEMARDGGGGIASLFKGFGIDLGGIGATLGRFFEGLMNGIRHFFSGISSGMFKHIGQSAPGMGMWDKLSLASDQAARADRTLGYETVLARNGAKGPIGDGIDRGADGKPIMHDLGKKDADGNVVKEQKYDPNNDHRVPLKNINGKQVDVYLTDGLRPSVQANGNVVWTVSTAVNGQGQSTRNEPVVTTREEAQRFYERLQQAARAQGKELQIPELNKAQPEQSNIHTTKYGPKGNVISDGPPEVEAPSGPGVVTSPVKPQTPLQGQDLEQTLTPAAPGATT